ncbi:MAG TPA: thioredoxin family protein [Streptosporangiaceae bacterium]|nr:thioredoxin family protein [Streptosporangiaceae bacterium]
MIPGLIASICALIAATALGLVWKQRNGRITVVAGRGELAAVPESVPMTQTTQTQAPQTQTMLTQADIGAALGSRATLVQFSSAFCAPCRATRRVLADVAGMVDGVAHVEIDAESRLDLVRRLDVRRTPTTLVLGPDGHVTHRASGQPRKADVVAALGAAL